MRARILLGVVPAVLGAVSAGPGAGPGTGAGFLPPAARAQAPDGAPGITPDEILVLGRPASAAGPGLSPASSPFALTQRARGRGLAVMETRVLSSSRGAARAFPGGAWVVRLEPGSDPETAARRLAEDPAIAYAGPNHVWSVSAAADVPDADAAAAAVVPDDSLFAKQYGLAQSNVPRAWERSQGEGIVIGVLDTGMDMDHPDLVTQIAVNEAEAEGLPGVDDDGNGFVDDVRGYDFTDAPNLPGTGDYLGRDADPEDEVGHGTQVAGVAAAAFNNRIGIAGVAPGARILPLRAAFSTRIPFVPALLQEDDIAAAILYAADRGADIINMSFGDVVEAPVISHAVAYARSRGVLLVAGAGNTGEDEPFYPAALPGVLSAGACEESGIRSAFSTFGQDLDVLAAGFAVITTQKGGTYKTSSGTSFSSPFSAGVAALVWSAHPAWTADQVAWQLRLTAKDAAGGWTPDRGWGILDADAAVRGTESPPVVQPEAVIPGDTDLRILGTATHPDLTAWTLFAAPDSAARAVGAGLPADAVTLAEGSGQTVAESLAVFTAPVDAPRRWVLSLDAAVPGYPPVTKRQRFTVPVAGMDVQDLQMTLAVGDAGWDAIASWSSPEPYQGAVRAGPAFVPETTTGRHHAVHVPGLLEAGATDGIGIEGRPEDRDAFTPLADTTWIVPPREQRARAVVEGGLPAGAPMSRSVDWNGDGLPEILVETPPGANDYGTVAWYELASPGNATLLGSSDPVFRGIPMDVADADGDGRPELLVYRVEGWTVWEAPAPGAFPDQPVPLPAEAVGLPLGFVDTGSGIRLLAADGRMLRAFRLDAAAGFVPAGEDSAAVPLGRPNAAGDFDGDGRLEVAVSGETSGIAFFEVTDQAVAADTLLDLPRPVVALWTRPVPGGRDELFSVELDPGRLAFEGDLDRALSRLRRWRDAGAGPAPVSTLAFAGLDLFGDVQLLDLGGDLVLRRRERFDVVAVGADAVEWGGTLARSAIPVTGSVPVAFPSGTDWIWAGTTAAGSYPGDGLTVVPDSTRLGEPLIVRQARSVPAGVLVVLGWEDDCTPESLVRSGGMRGTYGVPTVGTVAVDTLAVGETVTFTLTSPSCPVRTLELVGRAAPLPLDFMWADHRTLLVDLPRPLAGAPGSPVPPRDVATGDGRAVPSFQVVNEGTRLWIRIAGDAAADSLVLAGAWYDDGYPVGGTGARRTYRLPPRPDPVSDPVLASVRYRSAGGWHLEVTLGGGPDTCGAGFALEPGGLSGLEPEPAPPGAAYTLRIPLDAPLPPGRYTLRFEDPCAAGRASPLGAQAAFRVGPLVYPNPVPPGSDLVVENVEAGARVHIHDLGGVERAAFTLDGFTARRAVDDLAPGLYIVRIEDAEGRLLTVQKIVIRR